ncbi:MAG: GDSL-type esterase/lipase family protein [Ardenticatenaceae bacterium]
MKDRDIRVCVIGDSFVNGTLDPACLGWAGELCRDAIEMGYDVTYYNLGIRRDTSADIAARWRDECVQRLPDDVDGRVVFSFGVNDATIENGQQRVAVEETIANLRQMLHEASQRYATLMIGPPPIADDEQNARVGHLCGLMAAAAAEIGVPYLPVFETLIHSPLWMEEVAKYDGAHPRRAGYAELAALVQAWPEWWFEPRADGS